MVRSESKAAYWSFTSASVLLSFIEKPKSKLLSHCEIVSARARCKICIPSVQKRRANKFTRTYERKQSMSLCDWKRAEGNECFYEYRYLYIRKKTWLYIRSLISKSRNYTPCLFVSIQSYSYGNLIHCCSIK